jgi:pimeloyl-ACP methyl ester carboxylesterase
VHPIAVADGVAESEELRMKVLTGRAPVTGTELYYEVAGEGEWIVLVHGGEGTRIHWWQQVAVLAPLFRCVTYDMRGFGSSPVGEPYVSDNPLRDDLVGLLSHLGVERAILVGHSMGGLAASGLAQAHPERVRGLVMSDSPFNFATAALAEWAGQMASKIRSGFNVFEHLYANGFETRRPDLFYLYRSLNRLSINEERSRRTEAYETWTAQELGDYRGFPVPTLFIVGTEDELTLPWLMRATAKAVGGSELVEIENAGHSAYAERAEVYNAEVMQFCRSLPG